MIIYPPKSPKNRLLVFGEPVEKAVRRFFASRPGEMVCIVEDGEQRQLFERKKEKSLMTLLERH